MLPGLLGHPACVCFPRHFFSNNQYRFHDIPSREQSEGKLEDALGYMEDDSCGQVYGEENNTSGGDPSS